MNDSVADSVADGAPSGVSGSAGGARPTRLPRTVVVAWVLALAAVAALVAAVTHYLSGGGSGGHGMAGMAMQHPSVGDAVTRGGAHSPLQPLTSRLLTAWQLDAIAVAVVVLLAAAYATGVALVSRRAAQRWPIGRSVAFTLGLAVVVVATCGSIAVYDQVLFTAHMAQHLALVMVAPALIAYGRPLRLLVEVSPPARRKRLTRALQGRVAAVLLAPPVALATYTVVIVGTHLTGLMDTIMRNTWAGQVEHLVYLVAGYQFFVLIVGDEPIRWRLSAPARWLLLAIAMAVDTFTGIVLMQGTSPVGLAPSALSVDALSDTHAGGAIMWFGGDALMMLIMVVLVAQWLRTVETSSPEQGWLEQARRTAFDHNTVGDRGDAVTARSSDTRDLDSDDEARDAYNEWLARLHR